MPWNYLPCVCFAEDELKILGGKITVEAKRHGIKGKDCLKYIKDTEQLVGAKVVQSEFTEEYYQQNLENTDSYGVNQNIGY